MSEINWNSSEFIDFNWDRINIFIILTIDYSFSWILYVTFLIMIYFSIKFKLICQCIIFVYNCWKLYFTYFFPITFVTDGLEHNFFAYIMLAFNNLSKLSYWLILMHKKYIFASFQCLIFLFSQNLVQPPKKCGIE